MIEDKPVHHVTLALSEIAILFCLVLSYLLSKQLLQEIDLGVEIHGSNGHIEDGSCLSPTKKLTHAQAPYSMTPWICARIQ